MNPFEALGIPNDTIDEKVVKKAFLRLAHIHHPDKGGNAETFKKIALCRDEALKIISNRKAPQVIVNVSYGHYGMTYTYVYK